MTQSRRWALSILAAVVAGCSVESDSPGAGRAGQAPGDVFFLPKSLNEVSGLARASSNSVYAHNDEYGVVHEINLSDGKVIKAFALGDPTVKADFEGIAVSQGRIYMLTSEGRIFEAPIGDHGERVNFNVYDTGLSKQCEFEGLTVDAAEPGALLLLCKRSASSLPARSINIFRWRETDRHTPPELWLSISLDGALTERQATSFRPSGIVQREDGGFVIISAANAMLIEVNADFNIANVKVIGKSHHPQAEGVTVMASGDLVIADEGARRGNGRISIYGPER